MMSRIVTFFFGGLIAFCLLNFANALMVIVLPKLQAELIGYARWEDPNQSLAASILALVLTLDLYFSWAGRRQH